MRVLALLTNLFDATGGIQSASRVLVKALDDLAGKHGWGLTVFVLHDRGGNPLASSYITPARTLYRGFNGGRLHFSLAALRESWGMDAVILGHAAFCSLACAMNGAPKYLIAHGIEVWRPLPFLKRLGLARIRRILPVSAFTRDQMAKSSHLPMDRFHVLPNSLDPLRELFGGAASRRDLGLPEGRMILTVSRLEASEGYKGVDSLIQAMPKILERIPDALYVVVGGGSDLPRLRALAQSERVADRVYLMGRVEEKDLAGYYRHCDVFALPSWGEGFGIAFLEAMAFGKACVGAWAAGIPEVVQDGETGLLVPPEDALNLAQALVRLLKDGNLRASLGQGAKKRLEQEFSFEVFKRRLESLLCP